MRNYIQHYNLKPGDEIIVPKRAFNIIQHHALYLGYDENGTDWIIHNTAGVGVSLLTTTEFFNIYPQISEIRRYPGTNQERRQLVQRALTKIGKPYNLFSYNCQHFITDVKTGNPTSKQVENSFWGIGLGLALLGIFRIKI